MNRCAFTLLCGIILFGTSLPAADFSVGDFPVEVELPGEWRRQTSVPGLGKDQFFSPRTSVRLAVLQRLTPLGGKPAIDALFQSMMESMRGPSLISMAPREVLVDRGDRYALAQSAILREAGMEISYRWLITCHDGLTHIVVGFVPKPKQGHLQSILDPLVRKFPAPGPGSKWAKEGNVLGREVARDWGRLTFTHRPIAWSPGTSDDAFFQLDHSDGESIAFFEYNDWDAEHIIQSLVSHYSGSDYALLEPPQERSRGKVTGREVRGEDPNGSSIRSWLVTLDERSFLEIRFETGHSGAIADAIWESMLAAIEVEIAPPVFAFPQVSNDPTVTPPPPPAPASVRAWLRGSRWLGTADGVRASGVLAVDDCWVVYGQGGIQEITSDRKTRWIDDGEWPYLPGSVIAADQNALLFRWGGEHHRFDEESQQWIPLQPHTSARLELGPVRFQVEMSSSRSQVGFSDVPQSSHATLVRFEGSARSETPLPGQLVQWMVADQKGERALVALDPINLDESRPRWDLVDLQLLSRDGTLTPHLTGWQVEGIVGGNDEWLVTGSPAGGIGGIYRVPLEGEPELLLSGIEFRGVAIDSDHVVVAGPPYEPALESSGGTALYRVDRETLVAHGPASAPFGAVRMNEIAQRAVDFSEGSIHRQFESADAIRRFVARASNAAEDLCSRSLPTTGPELDRHFAQWIEDGRYLTPDGIALITALVTVGFLDAGAEWVPGQESLPSVSHVEPMRRATSFAVARNPGRIVWSTLFDNEGYWRPMAEVTNENEGRALYLGFDGAALMEKLEGVSDLTAFEVLEKSPGDIADFLKEHRKNIYLRYEIYEHLMARGRFADLQVCAQPFLEESDPLFFDRRAVLAARYAAGETSDTAKLIDDLLQFVRHYPAAPAAYDLLAHAYLRRGERDDGRRARACFDRVLTLTDRGDEVERARAGLANLGY